MDGKQATPSRRLQERRWLGRAIREARARRGISQEELGFRAGLHRNFVGAIERGETNPTFATLLNVVSGLDLALSVLIGLYERHAAEAS
jgi:transcriptional regulator with XRE-family HTH domain